MESPEEILENHVLNDPTICARCFNRTMNSQERAGTTQSSPPCSDKCGHLDISMESNVISASEFKSRANKLFSILDEKGLEIDEDAFTHAVDYYPTHRSSRQAFINAIAFGIGDRDLAEIPRNNETKEAPSKTSAQDTKSKDPLELLAEEPVTAAVINAINDDSVLDHVRVLETPNLVDDLYYLADPEEFETEFDVEKTGDHSPESVANCAAILTSNSQNSTIQRWVDGMDNSLQKQILSAAVRQGAPRNLPVDVHPSDSFRSSPFWPAVKRNVAQPVLSYLKQQNNEYVSTSKIAGEIEFDEEVVRRVLNVLYENEKVKPQANRGWKVNETVRFREEQVPDDK